MTSTHSTGNGGALRGTPSAASRAAYKLGWKASTRQGRSTSNHSALEAADARGVSRDWCLGYEDYAAGRPKWAAYETTNTNTKEDTAAMTTPTITITITFPTHGTYETTPAALDAAMTRYLPTSPRALRAIVEERTSRDYSDVLDVSALLIVLADLDDASRVASLADRIVAESTRVGSFSSSWSRHHETTTPCVEDEADAELEDDESPLDQSESADTRKLGPISATRLLVGDVIVVTPSRGQRFALHLDHVSPTENGATVIGWRRSVKDATKSVGGTKSVYLSDRFHTVTLAAKGA